MKARTDVINHDGITIMKMVYNYNTDRTHNTYYNDAGSRVMSDIDDGDSRESWRDSARFLGYTIVERGLI